MLLPTFLCKHCGWSKRRWLELRRRAWSRGSSAASHSARSVLNARGLKPCGCKRLIPVSHRLEVERAVKELGERDERSKRISTARHAPLGQGYLERRRRKAQS
jgi:hypothetical protein